MSAVCVHNFKMRSGDFQPLSFVADLDYSFLFSALFFLNMFLIFVVVVVVVLLSF